MNFQMFQLDLEKAEEPELTIDIQKLNARSLITSNPVGNLTDCRLIHPPKADTPIDFNLLFSVNEMDSSEIQSENALSFISSNEDGSIKDVILEQPSKAFSSIILSSEPLTNVTVFRLVHAANVYFSILDIFDEIFTLVIPVQYANAYLSIVCTEFGN